MAPTSIPYPLKNLNCEINLLSLQDRLPRPHNSPIAQRDCFVKTSGVNKPSSECKLQSPRAPTRAECNSFSTFQEERNFFLIGCKLATTLAMSLQGRLHQTQFVCLLLHDVLRIHGTAQDISDSTPFSVQSPLTPNFYQVPLHWAISHHILCCFLGHEF